jgi:hypothetical protein
MDGMILKSVMAVPDRGARRSCRSQRSQDTITGFSALASFLQHASAGSAVPEPTVLERELNGLEAALRKLENEYNMYFGGQLPRPPWESRRRVEALLRRFDRAYIQSSVDRFRLSTLQSRFSTFADLWDRGMRAREEGRPGPFSRAARQGAAAPQSAAPPAVQVVGTAVISDLARDGQAVEALYESLLAARRAVGTEEPLPFDRFAEIVKGQVSKLRRAGSREVAFRVTVKGGKVAFTARGLKGADDASA